MKLSLLAMGLCAWAALAQSRPTRNVPVLAKAPKVDGSLKDLPSTLLVPVTAPSGASASVVARAVSAKDTLYLGVEVLDDVRVSGDILTVSLNFPGAGLSARGYSYRFAHDGKRAPDADTGAPDFARALVQFSARTEAVDEASTPSASTGTTPSARPGATPPGRADGGAATPGTIDAGATGRADVAPRTLSVKTVFELGFPSRALPRFPAREPLAFELCLTFEDRDDALRPPSVHANCEGQSMTGGTALRLVDDFRKVLRVFPPDSVVGLEGRPKAWLGFGALQHPSWVGSDTPLDPEGLRALLADAPSGLRTPIPGQFELGKNVIVASVLTGKDPFAREGQCDAADELRLSLYLLGKGRSAVQVLEWPAANCALGRVLSFSVEPDGELTIGYSNGSTARFIWSGSRFERSELGFLGPPLPFGPRGG